MATTIATQRSTVRWSSGTNLSAGAWLALAPFLLGYAHIGAAAWNDVLVGLAVLTQSDQLRHPVKGATGAPVTGSGCGRQPSVRHAQGGDLPADDREGRVLGAVGEQRVLPRRDLGEHRDPRRVDTDLPEVHPGVEMRFRSPTRAGHQLTGRSVTVEAHRHRADVAPDVEERRRPERRLRLAPFVISVTVVVAVPIVVQVRVAHVSAKYPLYGVPTYGNTPRKVRSGGNVPSSIALAAPSGV